MSDLKSGNMGWGERLAIIDKFGLSDDRATSAFGVSTDELNTARGMADDGVFSTPTNINYSQYEAELGSFKKPDSPVAAPTSVVRPTVTTPAVAPITATKPKKEAKKRGRKGDKIINAFNAVPAEPVSAEQFSKDHNVSMAVLRQAKRFDTTGLAGPVKVKKDRAAGILMIWRESA